MDSTIEQLFQNIGREALAVVDDLSGRLLIYAEVEEAVIECGMFYDNGSDTSVRFRLCPGDLKENIYALWENWQKLPGKSKWQIMYYVIDEDR